MFHLKKNNLNNKYLVGATQLSLPPPPPFFMIDFNREFDAD